MTRPQLLAALVLLGLPAVSGPASAATIAAWDFNALPQAVNNNPAPSVGVGTAASLGMTNNDSYSNGVTGSVTTDDILASNAGTGGNPINSSDPNTAGNAWRVRGQNPGNGWNLAAPQYSQGVQFNASTAGLSNIVLTFDWFTTNQGVRDMQVQYTADGTTWNNIGGLLVATPNGWNNQETVNFAAQGITAVNDDATFGVRLVSAYDPALGNTYAAASLGTGGVVVPYNNNSGNWRFDEVNISSVPEPGSAALLSLGMGGVVLAATRRRVAGIS